MTAFGSWAEFAASLEGGYYPTLYPRTRRERLLRRVVLAHGFGVYPPARAARRPVSTAGAVAELERLVAAGRVTFPDGMTFVGVVRDGDTERLAFRLAEPAVA